MAGSNRTLRDGLGRPKISRVAIRYHGAPSSRGGYETALVPALRRVDGVRLVVGEGRTRAEVFGLGHRHPVTLSVTLGLAARLVEAGAPLELLGAETLVMAGDDGR